MDFRIILLIITFTYRYVSCVHTNNNDNFCRWGTYRSNIYVGIKSRHVHSPLIGVMWYDPNNPQTLYKIRHECQEGDQLAKYGWMKHDGRSFGVEELHDPEMGVKLDVEYVNTKCSANRDDKNNDDDGQDREGWSVRIRGRPLGASSSMNRRNISFVWYVVQTDESSSGLEYDESTMSITGRSTLPVGRFRVNAQLSRSSVPLKRINQLVDGGRVELMSKPRYWGAHLPWTHTWDVKPRMIEELSKDFNEQYGAFTRKMAKIRGVREDGNPRFTQADVNAFRSTVAVLPDRVDNRGSNAMVVQHLLEIPFDVTLRMDELDGTIVHEEHEFEEQLVKERVHAFDTRFKAAFPMKVKPAIREFAAAALSNMIGGVGHFVGSGLVQHDGTDEVVTTEVQTLLTGVPSRSFFPRGFLWDEGFHNLLISKWDLQLSLSIMEHWFNLTDANGWIAREQILGEEARSRVPNEFRNQNPNVANPPTLIWALLDIIEKVERTRPNSEDAQSLLKFAQHVYPNLKRHVEWYVRTQASDVKGAFAWRGRTVDHCLASGLDDYPRAAYINGRLEGHVDLHCWMIVLQDCMARISRYLADKSEDMEEIAGYHSAARVYEAEKTSLLESLPRLHWNEAKHMFCDFIVNPNTTKSEFVNHVGYVTFFPLMLRVLNADDPRLGHLLDLLEDETHTWSKWGVLSLSKRSKYYGVGENYWRGNIWMNMNYLTVAALHYYKGVEGPYQAHAAAMYTKLRKRLVSNVYKNYKRTGYLWEQYAARDGKGKRSHPFTGWTALVVLIVSEQF